MKGLILKDLYYLKGFARQYVLILAFMMACSALVKNSSFAITYLLVIGNTLILSTASADEAVSFSRFALTMPVSRKMLVKSKYILLVAVETAALLVGLILQLLITLIPFRANDASRWISADMEWSGIFVLFAMFMLINCAVLPSVFKLGVEKARNIYMMSMLGLAVLVFGGLKLCQMAGISLAFLNRLEAVPTGVAVVALLAVCAGAVALSYRISLRLVADKGW